MSTKPILTRLQSQNLRSLRYQPKGMRPTKYSSLYNETSLVDEEPELCQLQSPFTSYRRTLQALASIAIPAAPPRGIPSVWTEQPREEET